MCVSIQSLVLNTCVIVSSSSLPENSGLKYDQLNCGICGGGAYAYIGLGGFAGEFGGCIGLGTCTGRPYGCSGFGGGLAVDLEDFANVLEDLVEVVG